MYCPFILLKINDYVNCINILFLLLNDKLAKARLSTITENLWYFNVHVWVDIIDPCLIK